MSRPEDKRSIGRAAAAIVVAAPGCERAKRAYSEAGWSGGPTSGSARSVDSELAACGPHRARPAVGSGKAPAVDVPYAFWKAYTPPPASPMHAAVTVMTPRTLALPTEALLLPAPPRPSTTALFVLLLMTLLVAIVSMDEK